MIDDFFAKAYELVQQGVPFVTATVVRAEKPSSGKPGDKAIITVDGVMHGWIGGSCAQPTVIKEALKALAADEARLIRLSTEPEAQTPREGLVDLPMTCFSGGTLEIYLEPQQPRPRLVIVGTLPVARALARLGAAMNYHVVVVDLDRSAETMPYADETLASLEEIAAQVRPFTYAVVATHGNYDELALEKILAAGPVYVGLVASPKRASAVRAYLAAQGVSETEMLPLKAPAGLDIQARRGDEIALSIMAEIVQRRRNAELLNLALFQQQVAAEEETAGHHDMGHHQMGHHEHGHMAPAGETAIDPICGMEVAIATARYTHEHAGQLYYFCGPGCRETFIRERV
ncbi:MAG: XdhC family protein [Chloroflexi bacterium]|nr:XdhC family protein [Chloroflexota bacterium]MCI0575913.1 XdhC family protein [Chloroflexota bacterium]MCI0647553.1 XdhC family protein [Chloroflexota bacterium]MCI0729035.1 XdhC family protein [Chloroflexota bacterium]